MKLVPCHYDMARLQIADVGDSLEWCRVPVNMLKNQTWTVDMGWSYGFGIGRAYLISLILSSHLRLYLSNTIVPSSFTIKVLHAFLIFPMCDICPPPPSHPP
jgi:hypothetical protein